MFYKSDVNSLLCNCSMTADSDFKIKLIVYL